MGVPNPSPYRDIPEGYRVIWLGTGRIIISPRIEADFPLLAFELDTRTHEKGTQVKDFKKDPRSKEDTLLIIPDRASFDTVMRCLTLLGEMRGWLRTPREKMLRELYALKN